MKKNLFHAFLRKAATGLLALVFVLSMACFLDVNGSVVQASDTDYFITETCEGVTISENMTAPKPTTSGKESYIFAGYYAESTCDTPITATTTDTVFAKFVPAELMSVKVQVAPGTAIDTEKTDMRLVTTVDGLQYKEVGFEVYFNGATTPVIAKTTTVYKRILVTGENGTEYGYSPTAFEDHAEYFTTVNLINIANKNFDKSFFIKPYWKTLDGTTVYGMSRMARVSDSYNNIVNVPVRLYTADTVAAGSLDLAYDTDILTYVNYDNGDLYESVTVADDATNKKVTVTTPAEVADPNGMVANLRFQINDGVTMPSNTTFAVTSDTFTDAMIADVKYNKFAITYQGEPDTSWYDEFADGDTFVIATPADLYGLAEIVNGGTDQFEGDKISLGADIIVNEGTVAEWLVNMADSDTTNDPHDWDPIGKQKTSLSFFGTFEGQGNTISGIYMNNTDSNAYYYGLFGLTNTMSELRNFKLTNSYFRRVHPTDGSQALLGSVVGQPMGSLTSIYSDAVVVSENNIAIGGLAGRVNASGGTQSFTDCCFAGQIHVTSDTQRALQVGGIAGRIFNKGTTNISNCYNKGQITCTYSATGSKLAAVGGLVGVISDSRTVVVNIDNCLNTGLITVQTQVTGDDGTVTTTDYTKGVAGFFYNENYGTIADASGTTNVTATNCISTTSSHKQAYQRSNKKVDTDGDGTNDTTVYPMATFTNCESAKQEDSYYSGYEAYETAACLGIYTNDEGNDEDYWVVREEGLVTLKTFCDEWTDFGWYYNNKTDEADTFVIETAEELYAFSHVSQTDTFSGDTVQLGADIKMNTGVASYWATGKTTPARQFVPISKGQPYDDVTKDPGNAVYAFAGTFDGKGYEVSGIYVNETEYASNGFFGQVKAGSVGNFKLTNSYIVNDTGTHNTGAIVGNLRGGTVSNVYTDAIVKTTNKSTQMATGGIVGILSGGTKISNCWFEGEVHSVGYLTGGIVGRALSGSPVIENCISNGIVSSTYPGGTTDKTVTFIGGIVGGVYDATKTTIKNCLNMSTVTATVTDDGSLGAVVGCAYNKPLVLENVYTTVDIGGDITGIGNTTASKSTITGTPVLISESDLAGLNGYIYTDFDFANTWGAVEGSTPVIKDLYNGSVMTGLDAQRYSMDWYYNETYYNKSLTNSIDTFTIQNVDDFYGLSKIVNDGNTFKSKTVELVANGNFDLNPDYTVTVDQENGTVTTSGSANQWTPIGKNDTYYFDGTFNGNMNTIKGLYLNTTSARGGVFGTTGENAIVKNFTVDNSYYYTTKQYLAAVSAVASGDFENIYITENVWLESAYNTVSKNNCNAWVAGIVSSYKGSTEKAVSGCWFDGYITAYGRYLGGIAGQIYAGTKHIEDCLTTGVIKGTSKYSTFSAGIAGTIMGSSTDSPTAYLTNCVSAGTVNVQTVSAVGSVVGRSITGTNGTNKVRVTVHVENVYTTDNLVTPSGTTGGYHVNGFGDMSYQYGYIYGEPMIVSVSDIAGVEGYANTKLSYKSAAEDGIWVATTEGPKLAAFAEADVTDFGDTQRESISFMYNSLVYSEEQKANKTDKAADQQSTIFEIKDVIDMYGFASVVNELKTINGETELYVGKTVKLANDIIFNSVTTGNEAAGWADGSITAPTSSWVPIGTVSGNNAVNAFQGTFDGDGHTIKGLYVASDEQFLGLFRKIQDATICNLRLENSYIVNTKAAGNDVSTYMGSVAGGGDGIFENIYSDSIVKGQKIIGGLIGRVSQTSAEDTSFTMNSCQFNGVVNAYYTGTKQVYAGGMIGFIAHGEVAMDTCLYDGELNLYLNETSTSRSGFGARIGGLVGADNGTNGYVEIINCLSAGSVNSTVVEESATNPSISQMNHLIGRSSSADTFVKNTHVIIDMTQISKTGVETKRTAVREFDGTNSTAAAYDVVSTMSEDTYYGYGTQMWTDLSFTAEHRLAADDITLEEGQTASEVAGPIWAAIAGDLPIPATLAENALSMTVGKPDTDLAGSGTEADPWKITTVEELAGFAELSKTKTYAGEYVVLANDITINDGEDASKWVEDTASPTLPWYEVIGTGSNGKRFEGTFDGQKHTISGLCMERTTTYMGLFAATEEGSTVKNLRVENSYFEQQGKGYTGSIIGDCRGTVSNVYSDAIIESENEQVGGIIGRANGYSYVNFEDGDESTESRTNVTMDNCWYAGTINLKGDARYGGGIIGLIIQGQWKLTNCLFTGNINSEYTGSSYAYVGGICGAVGATSSYNDDDVYVSSMESKLTLESCVSAGTIQTVNAGYGAGAVVGRVKADVWFTTTAEDEEGNATANEFKEQKAAHLEMSNVFATRESGAQDIGHASAVTESDLSGNSFTATPTTSGHVVWVSNTDRLIGYCQEDTTSEYTGANLDFNSNWIIRSKGTPVPATFDDIVTKVETSTLDAAIGLDQWTTFDSSASIANAVHYGAGKYVLTFGSSTNDSKSTYETYIDYLVNTLGFTAYASTSDTAVYNTIFTKEDGDWVLNVLHTDNTGVTSITIQTGIKEVLSPNLIETNVTQTGTGTVSLSMLELTGSKCDFNEYYEKYLGYEDYYYGNSFVFKLPDGHFIINDGGNKGDFSGLIKYLKHLAGIEETDMTSKIYVDAWTVTHQHNDHFGIMKSFLSNKEIASQICVEAFYINEPNNRALDYVYDALSSGIGSQYRGVRMFKTESGETTPIYSYQTGQKYYFNGMTMEVIQSQEQLLVGNYAKRNYGGAVGTDFNTVSTNLMFTIGSGDSAYKIFITGDSNYVNMEYMKNAYGTSSQLLAGINVYQAMHHGKNTSYQINAKDNTFTDYLTTGLNGSGYTFDVTLFPCSVFYEVDGIHESTVFPYAGVTNEYLMGLSDAEYHYGNGTIMVKFGETIESGLYTEVDTSGSETDTETEDGSGSEDVGQE